MYYAKYIDPDECDDKSPKEDWEDEGRYLIDNPED